ncbi:hypothetical protein RHSIM_RhsimUnG0134600 [Rhododendron simsii]|uniref:Uncharacterized protein n=1 Tax=Rhododendron simsii TaxID=118357 RepID=A0A834FVX1_RHOSS|nr:hypothetical protein RHSIM_RhsimUnG0134600 [Rhododendron simsii]
MGIPLTSVELSCPKAFASLVYLTVHLPEALAQVEGDATVKGVDVIISEVGVVAAVSTRTAEVLRTVPVEFEELEDALLFFDPGGMMQSYQKHVKLLQTSTSTEKMYKIDDHVACAVAGIMSDANILINTARVQAQRYTFSYQEPMPVEQLVQSLCDTKQGYTQFGGLRPFGVSFLFAGWDKNYSFQLYMSDPSGNYGGWKAAAIGANNQAAQSMLKQDSKDEITREEAVQLALKVLSKTMDSTSLTSDKLELAEVFVSSGKVKYQVSSSDSLSKLLVKYQLPRHLKLLS